MTFDNVLAEQNLYRQNMIYTGRILLILAEYDLYRQNKTCTDNVISIDFSRY